MRRVPLIKAPTGIAFLLSTYSQPYGRRHLNFTASFLSLHLSPSHSPFPSRAFSGNTRASLDTGGSLYPTFMEFVKSVDKRGPSARDSVAIRVAERRYTYGDIISSAWNVSSFLRNADLKTGIEKSERIDSFVVQEEDEGKRYIDGARIGIVAKPSAEFVAGLLGIWLAGGVAVPLAISYPEMELLHVMNDSEVSLLLSTQEHQELMKSVAAKCASQFSLIPSCTTPNTDMQDSTSLGLAEETLDPCAARGNDAALILYTSGTTGKPKGVVHTHNSITSQVQILTEAWGYSNADQILHCLPLHHVHGIFNAMLAPLYAGAVVEFLPKFSVRGIWQRWRESYPKDGSKTEDAITAFTGVPTMYTRLLQGYELMDPEVQRASSSAACQLRLMMSGSSALPFPVMKQWETITGHRLLERYGMTEFVMAISNPLMGTRKGGTVGKPLPRVQVKVLEDKSSSDSQGVGELCVKSPSLFREYWKRPTTTKESFTEDGFFKTGDTVKVDEDGYYIILGRTNADIMKVGGYKLSALEIESVLLEHPAIAECAVLGLPDKAYGEIVCAIIVLRADAKDSPQHGSTPSLTLEDLQNWAKDKLAPYKIPTKLYVWDTLPRNTMGKVNKKELKKLLE